MNSQVVEIAQKVRESLDKTGTKPECREVILKHGQGVRQGDVYVFVAPKGQAGTVLEYVAKHKLHEESECSFARNHVLSGCKSYALPENLTPRGPEFGIPAVNLALRGLRVLGLAQVSQDGPASLSHPEHADFKITAPAGSCLVIGVQDDVNGQQVRD